MDNFIIDLLFLALVFWAGYIWGKATAVRRIIASIARDPEHLGRALDEFRAVRRDPDEPADANLVVERHGDQLYLYDSKDNEFLAQGATLELALAAVAKRYPDRRYKGHITREQAQELGIKS